MAPICSEGGYVCEDCSLYKYILYMALHFYIQPRVVTRSAVLLVSRCKQYLGTCQVSPALPYTNIINFFCFRNLAII